MSQKFAIWAVRLKLRILGLWSRGVWWPVLKTPNGVNICSLSKNFDDFCILIKEINMNFDIIAFMESRIKKN